MTYASGLKYRAGGNIRILILRFLPPDFSQTKRNDKVDDALYLKIYTMSLVWLLSVSSFVLLLFIGVNTATTILSLISLYFMRALAP